MHALSEEKSDDSKDSFYEELEQVFYSFPNFHMTILLGDFNAKVGRENIFKPTNGNEGLHQETNDNGARIVNFATSKTSKTFQEHKGFLKAKIDELETNSKIKNIRDWYRGISDVKKGCERRTNTVKGRKW